ncbi:MAG: hypothetical protein JSS60_07720 [Verrucomicrobia bacterium]|nr:hypothetical protein [Verrucomicrobiota bacterium]
MSVTLTGTTSSTGTNPLANTSATTQTQAGLSSVGDSMSSAATGCASGVCSYASRPFVAIGQFFASAVSSIKNFIASFFPETDKHRIAFIQENLTALTGDVYEEALDKFSHISNQKSRVEAFKLIQNSTDVSGEVTRAFYDLLPVDTQNHLERHIWIENGRSDSGQGMQFGKNVINSKIKAAIVGQAIDKCISESK